MNELNIWTTLNIKLNFRKTIQPTSSLCLLGIGKNIEAAICL